MVEKTFLVDIRSRAPGKFHRQVLLVVNELLHGNDVRIHCPDGEYGRRFQEAIDREIAKFEETYVEITNEMP